MTFTKGKFKKGAWGLLLSLLTSTAAFAETEIRAVMHSDLRVTDPIITTAHITRNHAYMIYDVLVAKDSSFNVRPQMADWTISDDGTIYSFTLRDGLKFHDGAPVTARDAVASLRRWAVRNPGGQMIMDETISLEAQDEKNFVWSLKRPFGPLLDTLAYSPIMPFIMPEAVANTPPDQPINSFIGSGPFKMVVEEFQPGIGATYVKNEDYVPRDEPPDDMAGGKVVHIDKVRWVSMPDQQTVINALASGEIDYVELVPPDLLSLVEDNDDVIIQKRAPLNAQTIGRMNFKHPPFDNQKIRQAALYALYQEPILVNMMALPEYYDLCGAIFGCGTPFSSEAGAETLLERGDVEKAKALLAEAGYDNTPIVLMQPTDVASLTAQPIVAAQLLRAAGFNIDLQPMDWQTLVSRRVSMAPPAEGGWNLFFTNWDAPDIASPLTSVMLNGRGDQGWFGWPVDETLESLKQDYVNTKSDEERVQVAAKIQAHVLDFVIYVPLGEYQFPEGRRKNIKGGIATNVPVFWNMTKEE